MTRHARPIPLLLALLAGPLAARGQAAGPTPPDPLPAAQAPAPAPALDQPPPGSFFRPTEPTRWRAAVTFGSGTSYGHSYAMFGGLLGYQVGGGFEVYLDGQYWGGARPNLGRLAPGVNWYAPIPYRPYLGVYYARWFVGGGEPDLDALGGRAGLAIASTPRAVLGAGMAYERVLACRRTCEAWWPELSVGIRF